MGKAVLFTFMSLFFGAGGALLRKIELIQAFDAGGLPLPGHPMTVALIVLSIFFAVFSGSLMLWLRQIGVNLMDKETAEPVSRKLGVIECTLGVIALLIMGASAVVKFTDPACFCGRFETALCAVTVLGAACGIVSFVMLARKDGSGKAGFMAPVAVMCVYLVFVFRQDGSDPVLLHYVFRLLAVAVSMLSMYYFAGASYENIKPSVNMFFAMTGIYLCAVALADERSLSDMLMFLSCIIYNISVIIAQSRYLSRKREALNREMYP